MWRSCLANGLQCESGENTAAVTSTHILMAFAGQLPATRNVALLDETSVKIQTVNSCPTARRRVTLPILSRRPAVNPALHRKQNGKLTLLNFDARFTAVVKAS
jgi:hypothetical protein